MGFSDIDLKIEYDSAIDDVYGDFFNKVLKHSTIYHRVGGKFNSKSLAACAEGLQDFIQKDGKMKLVLVPEFSKEDIDSINKGIKNPHEVITERWIQDFSEIRDKFTQDHVKALAWMLANDHLEIRIAVPTSKEGAILPDEQWKDSPLFRNKVGIFWDGNSNAISFFGTADFDDEMFGEYYHFRVYRGWDKSEGKYLEKDYEWFNQYWDGSRPKTEVSFRSIQVSDALRNSIIRIAPKLKSDIQLQSIPRLRPYQKKAVQRWIDCGRRGMFEMATGTGKTFAAIGCISEAMSRDKKLIVVIACPSDNLERQWQKELRKWNIDSTITSDSTRWARDLRDGIELTSRSDRKSVLVVITTYRTLSSEKFVSAIEKCSIPTFLIADEVHNSGSSTYRLGLSDLYKYRLGLSATLERYFDPDGTDIIVNFFGDTVYEMNMGDAIRKGFLVEYYYHIIPADLNGDEYDRYRKLTRTIARLWNSKDPEDIKKRENAINRRSWVIRDAEEKLGKLDEWVSHCREHVKYALIYCSERQMHSVKRILRNSDIVHREITAKNPSDPRERPSIIREFGNGRYDVIVANRVLDEGADIPAAKNCFMLASTGNPKQFIQRRGRVLRKYAGTYQDGNTKKHANIFDVIIIPQISPHYDKDEIRTERQILSSQIRRLEEMAGSALNADSAMKRIEELKRKFAIP